MVSTWQVVDRHCDWRREGLRMAQEKKFRPARAKGGDSGSQQAHANAGPKLHIDSMRFGRRDVGLLKCDP
jgi:hypothetical protein